MFEEYKDLLTTKDVSDILMVSQQMVRNLINQGKITGIKIGREYRVTKENLIKFVNAK